MAIRYECPHCGITVLDSKPTHIKSVQAIKFECTCNACKQITIVVMEAFYELPNRSLKKLKLDKFYTN